MAELISIERFNTRAQRRVCKGKTVNCKREISPSSGSFLLRLVNVQQPLAAVSKQSRLQMDSWNQLHSYWILNHVLTRNRMNGRITEAPLYFSCLPDFGFEMTYLSFVLPVFRDIFSTLQIVSKLQSSRLQEQTGFTSHFLNLKLNL